MTRHGQKGPTRRRPDLVRPRWVWGGLALALTGACVLGLGVSMLSWTPAIIGTVLLLVGTACSLQGGVLYDSISEFDPGKELHQVREGDTHEGVAPGEMVTFSTARDDALRSNETTRELETAALHPPHVAWAPVAGWLLLLVTAVLLMSQWELVAPTATGRSNSFRDTGFAILLGLGGLRLAVAGGRHPIVAGITALAGIGLVLSGLLADHNHVGLAAVEVTGGFLAVLCSVIAWVSPTRATRPDGLRGSASSRASG